jgi:hypothetical protein
MNPLSNHQLGQAQHREYEAKYGNRYAGYDSHKSGSPAGQNKVALVLSSATVAAVLVALARLF